MDNAKKKNNKMNNHSYNEKYNSRSRIEKLTLTALFTAIAVVGSMFSFPIFGSKCAPVQHLVNVLCAVTVGPWWGLGQAFLAALIRNLTGLEARWHSLEACAGHCLADFCIAMGKNCRLPTSEKCLERASSAVCFLIRWHL